MNNNHIEEGIDCTDLLKYTNSNFSQFNSLSLGKVIFTTVGFAQEIKRIKLRTLSPKKI